MYVWQHDLKVDTINVKQVTIFNLHTIDLFFVERANKQTNKQTNK